jgi:4-amino-4-deoxy-L-arabinose transferase-like glycosyltransferase
LTSNRYLLGLTALIAIGLKLFLARQLELYSDEIFYWQASRFPALAYSDLPFMSALLAGLGSWLFGDNPAAVRSLFLVMGCSIPGLIYWIARPITNGQQALESAALVFCLPLAAFLGLLAVPDVPMIFWGLLFIGFLERATRLDNLRWWFLAGVVAALGLSTHYRFALYILAALLYLLLCRAHWQHWRSARLWMAVAIAALGLYPALSFNLVNDLSGLDYHLLSRHPWRFQVNGLLHPVIQSVIVTPLLYGLLWFTLYWLVQRARNGDNRAGLLAAFAAVNLFTYLILAPWSDATRTTEHWPLSGYLPLLVFAPAALRLMYAHLCEDWSPRVARRLTLAVPALGLIGSLVLFAGIGSQGFNQQLQNVLGTGVLSNKMAGWQPMTQHLSALLSSNYLPAPTVIVTDNYYTSAQIKFADEKLAVFTIDKDKTVRDGRATQYAIWAKDEIGLRQQMSGHDAIFITEDSTLNYDEMLEVMNRACDLFGNVSLIDQLFLYQGDKVFSFYLGQTIAPDSAERNSAQRCQTPSLVWLDYPQRGETMSGEYRIAGWIVNNGFGVDLVRILLNGEIVGETTRTLERPDVVRLQKGELDPDAPMLGFEYHFDTRRLRNGSYELAIEAHNRNGVRQIAAARRISISN